MSKENNEIPEHPDGIPFPPGGIQAIEGPHGHQRIVGQAAKFIYPGFDQIVRVVLKTTYHHGLGESDLTYRAILQDMEGDVHLSGGEHGWDGGTYLAGAGENLCWIDLDYGWVDAIAAIDAFIEKHSGSDDMATGKVVEGKEEYYRLRASMN